MRPEKQFPKNTWLLNSKKYNSGYCLHLMSNNQTDPNITCAFIAVLQSTYRLRNLLCVKAQICLPAVFGGAHSKMQFNVTQQQCGQWSIIPAVPTVARGYFPPTFSRWTQARTQTYADQVKASSIPAQINGSASATLECLGSGPDWKADAALR